MTVTQDEYNNRLRQEEENRLRNAGEVFDNPDNARRAPELEANHDNNLTQRQFHERVINQIRNNLEILNAPLVPNNAQVEPNNPHRGLIVGEINEIFEEIEEDTGPEAGEPFNDTDLESEESLSNIDSENEEVVGDIEEMEAEQNPFEEHFQLANAPVMAEQIYPIYENGENAVDEQEELQSNEPSEIEIEQDNLDFEILENYTQFTMNTDGLSGCYGLAFEGNYGCGLAHISSIDSIGNSEFEEMKNELNSVYEEGYEENDKHQILRDYLELKMEDIDCTNITFCVNVEFNLDELLDFRRNNNSEHPLCDYVSTCLQPGIKGDLRFFENFFHPDMMVDIKFINTNSKISINTGGELNISSELPRTQLRVNNLFADEEEYFVERNGTMVDIKELAENGQEHQLIEIVNNAFRERGIEERMPQNL